MTAYTVTAVGGGTRRNRYTSGVSDKQTIPVTAAVNSIRFGNAIKVVGAVSITLNTTRSNPPMTSAPNVVIVASIQATVTNSARPFSTVAGVRVLFDFCLRFLTTCESLPYLKKQRQQKKGSNRQQCLFEP